MAGNTGRRFCGECGIDPQCAERAVEADGQRQGHDAAALARQPRLVAQYDVDDPAPLFADRELHVCQCEVAARSVRGFDAQVDTHLRGGGSLHLDRFDALERQFFGPDARAQQCHRTEGGQ